MSWSRILSGRAFAAMLFLGLGSNIPSRFVHPPAHQRQPALQTGSSQSIDDLLIFDDTLRSPWSDASWNVVATYGSTEQARTGTTSIKAVLTVPWGMLSVHHGEWNSAGIDPALYERLSFDIFAPSSETSISVFFENDIGQAFPKINAGTPVEATWVTVSLPMRQLNPSGLRVHRVCLQEFSGTTKTFYIDNFRFIAAGQSGAPSPPDLLEPVDGAADMPVDLTFRWDTSAHAETYRLQISTSDVFSTTVVDESNLVETETSVSGLVNGTNYFWRVSAQNGSGASAWSQVRSFSTLAALPDAPSLASPPDGSINQDTALVLRWNSVPGADSYRLQVSTVSSFTTSLVDEALITVTSRQVMGLSANTAYFWRVNAKNSAGTGGWSPAWTFITTRSESGTLLLQTTIPFPQKNGPTDYSEQDYRIVGLPGASMQPVAALISGNAGEDWQLYWDNGLETDYMVPYRPGSEFVFQPGKAFWMIKTSPWTIDLTIPACTLNAERQVEIILHPGWNLITSPFLNPVNWESVQSLNSTNELLYAFTSEGFIHSETLAPYQGYYFYNNRANDTLRIPLDPVSAPPSESNTTIGKDLNGWRAGIIVRSGPYSDQSLWFGVEERAHTGLDAYDVRKPRSSRAVVHTSFRRPAWDPGFDLFAADIRPPFSGIEQWEFEVRVPRNMPFEVSCTGLKNIPEELGVILVDRGTGLTIDLRSQNVCSLVSPADSMLMSVMIGRHGELEQIITAPAPSTFSVGMNFPNPFNPSTTIPFTLAVGADVTLTIHDALGRTIRNIFSGSLSPGLHHVVWDGRDDGGMPVSSGVYFCRMQAREEDGRMHTSQAKMVFMK